MTAQPPDIPTGAPPPRRRARPQTPATPSAGGAQNPAGSVTPLPVTASQPRRGATTASARRRRSAPALPLGQSAPRNVLHAVERQLTHATTSDAETFDRYMKIWDKAMDNGRSLMPWVLAFIALIAVSAGVVITAGMYALEFSLRRSIAFGVTGAAGLTLVGGVSALVKFWPWVKHFLTKKMTATGAGDERSQ